jgi:hypothetical protein
MQHTPEPLFAERQQRFFAAEEKQAFKYRWVGWLRLSFFVGAALGGAALIYTDRRRPALLCCWA